MLDDNTDRSRIVAATMKLAAERRWGSIGLTDIAAEAGLRLADIAEEFETRTAILRAFRRELDGALLRKLDDEKPEGNPREKLFDVIMTRLELMQPYKPALRSIARGVRGDPAQSVPLACGSMSSLALMLEASCIRASGSEGCLKVSGLAYAMQPVAKAWFDDGPDNSRTMAALDRALRDAEDRWKRYATLRRGFCDLTAAFRGRRGQGPVVTPAPAPPPPAPPEMQPAPA